MRCVVLFRFFQHIDRKLLRELIPLDQKDKIVFMENGDAALLLNTEKRTQDEILEFAAAAAETVENEAGITCFAGTGNAVSSLEKVCCSFREAECALLTGIRHKIEGRVFAYCNLKLERLVDSIPSVSANALKQEIIPDKYEKLLTEETIETIRAFFKNDLNLSTTARQLFIHRNTLIYRMEKIRKATGLDLRKFEDAVIFRIMMSFAENNDERGNLK